MISRLSDDAVSVSRHQHLRYLAEIPTCVARAAIKYPDQVKSIARPVLRATCRISENEIRDCWDSLMLPGDKNYPVRRDDVSSGLPVDGGGVPRRAGIFEQTGVVRAAAAESESAGDGKDLESKSPLNGRSPKLHWQTPWSGAQRRTRKK